MCHPEYIGGGPCRDVEVLNRFLRAQQEAYNTTTHGHFYVSFKC